MFLAANKAEVNVRGYLYNRNNPSVEDLRAALRNEHQYNIDGVELFAAVAAAGLPRDFLSLEDVQSIRRQHQGRELPGYMPYAAVENLVQRYTKGWARAARECAEQVAHVLRREVASVVQNVMASYPAAIAATEWVSLCCGIDLECGWQGMCGHVLSAGV